MKMILLKAAFQFLCSVSVLFVVWHHVHWSVALLLTITMVRFDSEDFSTELDKERMRAAWELYRAARETEGARR